MSLFSGKDIRQTAFLLAFFLIMTHQSFGQISMQLYRQLPDSLRPQNRLQLTSSEVSKILNATYKINGWGREQYGSVDTLCLKFAPDYVLLKTEEERRRFLHDVVRYLYRGINHHNSRFAVRTSQGAYENPLMAVSINYCKKALKKKTHDTGDNLKLLGEVMFYRAHFLIETGKFKDAFNTLQQALVISKKIQYNYGIVTRYTSMASLFRSLDLPKQTLLYCDSAETLVRKTEKGEFYYNAKAYVILMKQFSYSSLYARETAPQYADSVLALHEDAKIFRDLYMKGRFLSQSHVLVALVDYSKGKYEAALANIDSAAALVPDFRAINGWERAVVVKALSLRKQGRTTESDKVIGTLNLVDFRQPIILMLLQELYGEELAKGNYQKALTYLQKINMFQARKQELDTQGNALEMEQIYNVRQRELQIEQLNELQHRNQIIALSIFVIILLIVVILVIRYRATLAKKNNLVSQLEEVTQLQVMKLEDARAGERKILGQFLHDGLSSTIAGIRNRLQLVMMDVKGRGANEQLEKIFEEVDQAYEMARAKSHNWYKDSGITREESFASQIHTLADSALQGKQYEKDILIDAGGLHNVSIESRIHLLRIIQEALINIVKHANAKKVNILIYEEEDGVTLMIKDDGRGMRSDKIKSAQSGIGLSSMRDRVQAINGKLEIKSGSEGTEVIVFFQV